MHARFLALVDKLKSSYWFIPTLMVIGAFALSFATTAVDGWLGPDWIENVSWLYANKPEGARNLLTTVAGSMIGVAGVTFSITIASVVYASGQYGPRLLTNFMSDRGNQITLGTFIATFVYCLLVLRTVRSADEASGGENPAGDVIGAFVPHVAIVTALALTLASVGVLIFFIHHVPESIHVSNVISGVGRDLRKKIDTLFPERIGDADPGWEARRDSDVQTQMPADFYLTAEAIRADGTGYIQGVDADTLLEVATEHDLVLRLRHRPGDFISDGDALLLAWPAENVTDDVCSTLRVAFAWGRQRTALQDTRFLVNELVEIAARALSPGINDPFTAISCLDWLSAALKALADRDFPSAARYDDSGNLRVVAEPTTFEEFVGHVYGQLRPYVASDRNAALHTLKTIGELAARASGEQRRALQFQADAILEGTQKILSLEADRHAVRDRHRLVAQLLFGEVNFEEAASRADWIGGTA
ncbi:DUF2254 domain-containing protein [Rubricoccus marinus]|uniref:DUF2254 domain-containing protein n=1 Tax=Rubricoccus marinus TaxID=716817 RepID=A0A259U0A0_9BACT|nr:DUF2254 domain-containing protein [Rubricoccus marinus]OZC03267.1 hypothetical protein BSZ36_09925 [Rubricoccus marinus]